MPKFLASFTGDYQGPSRLLHLLFSLDSEVSSWAVARVAVIPIDGTIIWGPRSWDQPGSLPMLWMARAWLPSLGSYKTLLTDDRAANARSGGIILVTNGQQWGLADGLKNQVELIDLDGLEAEFLTPEDQHELRIGFNRYVRWLATGE